MSVENWQQGQPGQRQRTIIASGAANVPVAADYFQEPRGAPAPAKTTGEGPDASNKAQGKPADDKPAATKKPAPVPSKPKGGE